MSAGSHVYYEELALRYAEHGIDALAIDYFARTAGPGRRGPDFDYAPHVAQTTWETLAADIRTGVATPARAGLGGRQGADADLHDRVLHGRPADVPVGDARPGPRRAHRLLRLADRPVPQRDARAGGRGVRDRVTRPRNLGRRGPRDRRTSVVEEFEAALRAAGVEHRSITYPGAPHSFFDRTAVEHAEASAAAWAEVLSFIRGARAHPGTENG